MALAAACRRAPVEPAAEPTPDLSPPAPSSTIILSSPAASPSAYINETQALPFLNGKAPDPPQTPVPSLSKAERKLRRQQLNDMGKQFARMRRNIDSAHDKSVTLPGSTVGLIPGPDSGRALTVEADASTSAVKKESGKTPK